MKYVILKKEEKGFDRLFPVIFPEYMVHVVIAQGVQNAYFREHDDVLQIHSAGFCNWNYVDQEWCCERGSESMCIKKGSNDDNFSDAQVLNMPEAMQGIRL